MSDICAAPLNDIWNTDIIAEKSFPNNFRLLHMTPVFKKEDLLRNYRSVSALVAASEIYEKIMQKQVLEYIHKHLFPHLCG